MGDAGRSHVETVVTTRRPDELIGNPKLDAAVPAGIAMLLPVRLFCRCWTRWPHRNGGALNTRRGVSSGSNNKQGHDDERTQRKRLDYAL
jgi:hypothetical protein